MIATGAMIDYTGIFLIVAVAVAWCVWELWLTERPRPTQPPKRVWQGMDAQTAPSFPANHAGHVFYLQERNALTKEGAEAEAQRRYVRHQSELERWGR